MDDFTKTLQATLNQAIKENRTLRICGGDSKNFLTPNASSEAQLISTQAYQGVVSYEPTELVITVKSGTKLTELVGILDDKNQHLSFDPPLFSEESTVGGMIACGISGTSRPWKGLIRDSLLGCKVLNGKAEVMHFGGQVFKNVAGFDLFRPQAGAWGTLGIVLELSLRVNPKPKQTRYFSYQCSQQEAFKLMQKYQQHPHPISGLCWYKGVLQCRLAGFQSAIEYSISQLHELQETPESEIFWQQLARYQLSVMRESSNQGYYKLYTQCSRPLIPEAPVTLIDWGGAIRWYDSRQLPIQQSHLSQYCSHYEKWLSPPSPTGIIYSPMSTAIWQLHQNIRHAFDPHKLFNQHLFQSR